MISGLSTVTVTGTFVNVVTGLPSTGSIRFSLSGRWVNQATDTIVTPGDFPAVLDANGHFSVTIPATDDPDFLPTDRYWTITEFVDGSTRTYAVLIPASPSTQDLSDIAPIDPTDSAVVYELVGTRGATGNTGDLIPGTDPTGNDDSTAAVLAAAVAAGSSITAPTVKLGPGTFKLNLIGLDRIYLEGASSDLTTIIPASATSPIISAGGTASFPDQYSYLNKVRITTGGVHRPYRYPLLNFTLTRNLTFGNDVFFDVAPYVCTCVHGEGSYQYRWQGVHFRSGRYGVPYEFANTTVQPGSGLYPQCDTFMFDMNVDGAIGAIFRDAINEVHGVNFFTKVVQTTYYAAGAPGDHTTLSGAHTAAATSIVVASATGITQGDLLMIDPGLNNCEPVKVSASYVSGTTVLLDAATPLRFNHPSGTEVFRGGVCFSFGDGYNSIKFHEFHSEGQQIGVAVGNVHNLMFDTPYKGCGRLIHSCKDLTELHVHSPVMFGTANLNELMRRSSNNTGSNFDGNWECTDPYVPTGAPITPAIPNGSGSGGDYFPHVSKNWRLVARNGSGGTSEWWNVNSGQEANLQRISMVSGVQTLTTTYAKGTALQGRLGTAIGVTLVSTDAEYVGITDTSSTRSVVLPSAASCRPGKTFVVVDESNAAGTNNITVQRAGSDTIIGGTTSTTVVISTNGGNRKMYSDGTSKWIVV